MANQRDNPYRRAPKPRGGTGRPAAEKRPGLRELPSDLHALADGRVDRLRRPPKRRDAIAEDDHGRHVIPGVRNSESRAVYDRRVAALRQAAERDDAEALGSGLYEVQCLALWRARNITDFDAFAEDVVGISVERARERVAAAVEKLGDGPRPLPTEVVALWVRAEAALIQVIATGTVHVRVEHDGPRLQIDIPAQPAARAIDAVRSVSTGVAGLGKLLASGPPPGERD